MCVCFFNLLLKLLLLLLLLLLLFKQQLIMGLTFKYYFTQLYCYLVLRKPITIFWLGTSFYIKHNDVFDV